MPDNDDQGAECRWAQCHRAFPSPRAYCKPNLAWQRPRHGGARPDAVAAGAERSKSASLPFPRGSGYCQLSAAARGQIGFIHCEYKSRVQ